VCKGQLLPLIVAVIGGGGGLVLWQKHEMGGWVGEVSDRVKLVLLSCHHHTLVNISHSDAGI
jgi:hypothetical protein